MNTFFSTKWTKLLSDISARPRDRSRNQTRRRGRRVGLESLEDRRLLTVVDISGLITTSETFNDTTVTYEFVSNSTISSTGSVTFGPNVNVQIGPGVSVSDQGSMTLQAGATLGLDAPYYATTYLGITGTLSASGATLQTWGGNYGEYTRIEVASGGHLIASNSTFGTNDVLLDSGSVLNSGDLSGNTFNTPLSVPALDIPLLTSNKYFQTINITDSLLASGQTLALNQIGTNHNYSALTYVFQNSFTVQAGATLTVGPNTLVQIGPGTTFSDQGSMSLGTGATLGLDAPYYATTRVVVSGKLSANGASLQTWGGNYGEYTVIEIAAGGRMTATNSTFGTNSLALDTGSVLNTGDLTGNTFNTPLSVPALDIPLLTSNKYFQTINITDGSLAAGKTLALNLIGTNQSYGALTYVFQNSFTVQAGATLTVGPNTLVQIGPGTTFSDQGSMSLGTGATLGLDAPYYATTRVVVSGKLSANGASLQTWGGNYGEYTVIEIAAGGRMTATNSTFGTNSLALDTGSVLNTGDLTGNTFNTPLSVPALDIPLLTSNKYFQTINISDNLLTSGHTLALNLIGTNQDYGALTYVFSNNFTVQNGATVTIGPNTLVQIGPGTTFTDQGNLTVGSNATLGLDAPYYATTLLLVTGSFYASGANIGTWGGNYGEYTRVSIASGGHFVATNTTFSPNNLSLQAGSIDYVRTDTVSTQLNIDSGASIGSGIGGNNFTNGTVIASGDPTKTISFTGNYWGTTVASQIAAKITDHSNNANLPKINAGNPLQSPSAVGQNTSTAASPWTVVYNAAAQTVTFSATVTSLNNGPLVNEGSVTFTILDGARNVRNPVIANVVNGVATTTAILPGGVLGGSYTVLAIYNGTVNFIGSVDSSSSLVVSPASTNTLASTTTSSVAAGQSALLSAVVTSPAGVVLNGSETFTILSGTTVIGNPVTANVVNGVVKASYPIPVGTAPGSYAISAVYNGSPSFQASSADTTQSLTVSTAAAAISAVGTSATFSTSSQAITLTANLTPSAINEGSVTFTVLSGNTPIGSPVTVNVVNGVATTANYVLPASTPAGAYTIQALYNGTANFGGAIDTTQHLTLNAATSQTAASNATAAATQTVTLSANVTSAAGNVNEGTVTFTVLNGTTVIGKAVSASVVNGVATAAFLVPAGTLPALYTIKANYNGTTNFSASVDMTQSLTVVAASATTTTLTSGSINVVYNPTSTQPLNLTATVASAGGTVNEGTVTFQIKQGTAVIVSAVTVPVVNGTASTTGYTLPTGTAAGTYVISVVYNDIGIFLGSSDVSHKVVVSAASTTVTTASATASVSPLAQSVSLSATVASGPMSVGEGIVTFTIYSSDGLTKVGQAVQGTVVNGVVTVSYTLPANLTAGNYIIQAVYTDPTGNYASFTDTSKRLVLS